MADTAVYEGMSLEELLDENQKLMQERADAQASVESRQLALNEMLDIRIAEQKVRSEVAEMPESERKVMMQVLQETPAVQPAEVTEVEDDG